MNIGLKKMIVNKGYYWGNFASDQTNTKQYIQNCRRLNKWFKRRQWFSEREMLFDVFVIYRNVQHRGVCCRKPV